MKCIFDKNGKLFLRGPDNHRDYDGHTSYVVPDEINFHVNDIDPLTKQPGVRDVTEQELKDRVDAYMAVYSNARKVSYPSIQDQLDTLYHQGYDGWKAQIDAIKAKYPKASS